MKAKENVKNPHMLGQLKEHNRHEIGANDKHLL
jgi:hypothetical protein